eukprot:765455-Hanusia_phi.AAC.3
MTSPQPAAGPVCSPLFLCASHARSRHPPPPPSHPPPEEHPMLPLLHRRDQLLPLQAAAGGPRACQPQPERRGQGAAGGARDADRPAA